MIIAAILLSVQNVVGPATKSSGTTGGGGGGGSSLSADKFKNYLERWQKESPDKFDYIKSLLYKEPFTTEKYVPPRVNLIYNASRLNISRNDEVEIGAYIENPNPIEIRRALYLSLEAKGPEETVFKPIGMRQIIQVNDYETSKSTNYTSIEFPEPTSFQYLKRVGKVELRINVSDGKYKNTSQSSGSNPAKGYFSLLSLNVFNIPPRINNSTMKVTANSTWDGFIEYRAELNSSGWKSADSDSKKSTINGTLHIYDENGTTEVLPPISKTFPESDEIVFNTKDAQFFKEDDAGKNFTYRISVSDGILGGANTTYSALGKGPRLKRTAKIIVSAPTSKDSEDASNSWWHKYSFSINVKARDPDVKYVAVTLITSTPTHPGRTVNSPGNPMKLAVNTEDETTFIFNDVKPFDVLDCGKNYSYCFAYDTEDMNGNRQYELVDGGQISPKAISYPFESLPGVGNLLLLLLSCLAMGVLIERSLFRRR
jgi:hypothetical protein